MDSPEFLIIPLLQGFSWFDDGLQAYMRTKGWPNTSRPQSMVMIHVVSGVTRPAELARRLGVSRQAMHVTISQMVDQDILELRDDPADGRSKRVEITVQGQRMRRDAQEAMRLMTAALEQRIGAGGVAALRGALGTDWGPPLERDSFTWRPVEATVTL